MVRPIMVIISFVDELIIKVLNSLKHKSITKKINQIIKC